jgi:hypothetical protein
MRNSTTPQIWCAGVIQNQRWAGSMKKLLDTLYGTKRKVLAKGLHSAPQKLVDDYSQQYDQNIGRRFFTNLRIPFSNNIGEKNFRMSKLKMKVAGSFRADGGFNFCLIFPVIDTIGKNSGNLFKPLVALFNNSFSLSFLS